MPRNQHPARGSLPRSTKNSPRLHTYTRAIFQMLLERQIILKGVFIDVISGVASKPSLVGPRPITRQQDAHSVYHGLFDIELMAETLATAVPAATSAPQK